MKWRTSLKLCRDDNYCLNDHVAPLWHRCDAFPVASQDSRYKLWFETVARLAVLCGSLPPQVHLCAHCRLNGIVPPSFPQESQRRLGGRARVICWVTLQNMPGHGSCKLGFDQNPFLAVTSALGQISGSQATLPELNRTSSQPPKSALEPKPGADIANSRQNPSVERPCVHGCSKNPCSSSLSRASLLINMPRRSPNASRPQDSKQFLRDECIPLMAGATFSNLACACTRLLMRPSAPRARKEPRLVRLQVRHDDEKQARQAAQMEPVSQCFVGVVKISAETRTR